MTSIKEPKIKCLKMWEDREWDPHQVKRRGRCQRGSWMMYNASENFTGCLEKWTMRWRWSTEKYITVPRERMIQLNGQGCEKLLLNLPALPQQGVHWSKWTSTPKSVCSIPMSPQHCTGKRESLGSARGSSGALMNEIGDPVKGSPESSLRRMRRWLDVYSLGPHQNLSVQVPDH